MAGTATAKPRTGGLIEAKALARFQVKALDAEARTFEGLASTWDRDLGDDVIHHGAFKRTVDHWRQSGRVLPLIDQHNYDSVRRVVGKLLDAKETDDGLWTKWEVIDGPDGDEILRRLKGGFIDGLSIGYRPVKYDFEEADDARWGEIRHLREVELKEVSLVIWGMNPGALVDTSSVKALLRKGELSDDDRAELSRLRDLIDRALQPAAAKTDAPDGPAPTEDDDAPDLARLDRLRLRALGLPV